MRLVTNRSERKPAGFTLGEVLVSFAVFALAMGGLVAGYVQVNRLAEYSSMSLAAQSFASQGLEVARSGQWNYVRWPNTNYGPGTGFTLGFAPTNSKSFMLTNFMDIPMTGAPIWVTDFVTMTWIQTNLNPQNPILMQVRSDCVWTLPVSGRLCTNTALGILAPGQ